MLTSWQNQKRTLKRLSFKIRYNRMFLNGALPALPAAAICSCNSSTSNTSSTSNITLVVVLAVVTVTVVVVAVVVSLYRAKEKLNNPSKRDRDVVGG